MDKVEDIKEISRQARLRRTSGNDKNFHKNRKYHKRKEFLIETFSKDLLFPLYQSWG
jgi:hypothetical protein